MTKISIQTTKPTTTLVRLSIFLNKLRYGMLTRLIGQRLKSREHARVGTLKLESWARKHGTLTVAEVIDDARRIGCHASRRTGKWLP